MEIHPKTVKPGEASKKIRNPTNWKANIAKAKR
jgi:hypothetical protein